MLKKRSKTVSTKQGVMSHTISLASLTGIFTHRPTSSSPFPSLNPLLIFSHKQFSDPETAVKYPNFTQYFNFKPFSSISNPFFSDRKARTCISKSSGIKHHLWDGRDCKAVGLAIVDKSFITENRTVQCGSLMKVRIPPTRQSSFPNPRSESPHCPIEFGVKNKESQLSVSLLSPVRKSTMDSTNPSTDNSPRALCLSASEIELSEDYTCVISRGLQEKKTHIFDNIIIESCGNGFSSLGKMRLPSEGNDVFIYSGENTFCTQECRNREIIYQEGSYHS